MPFAVVTPKVYRSMRVVATVRNPAPCASTERIASVTSWVTPTAESSPSSDQPSSDRLRVLAWNLNSGCLSMSRNLAFRISMSRRLFPVVIEVASQGDRDVGVWDGGVHDDVAVDGGYCP